MQTSNFKLISITEIKTKYPFLIEDEKFDCYKDWEDADFFLIVEKDVDFDGNFYLDFYEEK